MAYNNLNKLLLIRDIQELSNLLKNGDERTYSWIWRNHINPVYRISYATYLKYISMGNVEKQIRELEMLKK